VPNDPAIALKVTIKLQVLLAEMIERELKLGESQARQEGTEAMV